MHRTFLPQRSLPFNPPASQLSKYALRKPLLYHLHHGRRIAHLGLTDQRVKMFRHDDIPKYDKLVALPGFLQNLEEQIPPSPRSHPCPKVSISAR